MLRKYLLLSISAFIFFCLCYSCTRSSFVKSAKSPLVPDNRSVLVLELFEHHTDTFEFQLAETQASDIEMPFIIQDQRVYIRSELLNEIDPKVQLKSGLTLGNPHIPLSQCKVLIKRHKSFKGAGRTFNELWFYAFSDLPATIHLPGGVWDNAEGFEVFQSPGSPLLAVEKIRFFGDVTRLKLNELDEGDALHLLCGSRNLLLRPASQTIIKKSTKTLAIHVSGISLADVELDDSLSREISELPQMIVPSVTLSGIHFSSKLTLRYHGRLPLSLLSGTVQ